MKNLVPKKLRWWIESVQGLVEHLKVHMALYEAFSKLPLDARTSVLLHQLREQEGMVGNCLLHVIGVYPIGSGRFWDEDLDEEDEEAEVFGKPSRI